MRKMNADVWPIGVMLLCLAAFVNAGESPREVVSVFQPTAAILDQPDLPVSKGGSSPKAIATMLERAGWRVRRLSAEEMADAKLLTRERFGLVVLPYGALFPATCRESLTAYLHQGGGLVTVGGYAFNHLVRKIDGRWVGEEDRIRVEFERATRPERSILPNGGFEQQQQLPMGGKVGEGLWQRSSDHCRVVKDAIEGRFAVLCERRAGESQGASAWLDIPARPGRTYQISGQMRTSGVDGQGIAFMAIYQYDAAGKLVEFRDFASRKGTTPWQRYEHVFTVQPNTARLRIPFGLYESYGAAWFEAIRLCDVTGLQFQPMNTASGRPADGLEVSPEQIGMFDASFPLQRACRVRTAADQLVVAEQVDLPGDFQGWAASGVVGMDAARWVPLLQTHDCYGRARGAAGAMLLHYGGPFAGSMWAYFGIENVDLFADPEGATGRALTQIARFMRRKVFLHNLATGQRLYKVGEPMTASVVVDNRGDETRRVAIEAVVSDSVAGDAVERQNVTVPAGKVQRVEIQFPKRKLAAGMHRVVATLYVDDEPIDRMQSGFVVEPEQQPRRGVSLRFANNYFTLDGRPMFLFGSDTYGVVYNAACENPLTWTQEVAAARDIGMNLYEILQHTPPEHRMEEGGWRALGALNQIVHDHGLVFMPGMLIGHNVTVGEEMLREESALCAEYAKRLGSWPGMLWYINGDYALNAQRNPEATKRLWNDWLKQKYPTAGELARVWGSEAVKSEMGGIEYPPANSGRWDDAAAVDDLTFQNWLTLRWNQHHVSAIRERDSLHPITSEYYSIPLGGLDLVRTIGDQDVANIGYFERPETEFRNLPLRICLHDLRLRGKGASLGEYGVLTHPAWSVANGGTDYHIVRSEEDQKRLFMAVAHYALGLGACKVQNWCLRDDPTRVFPWGLFYPNQLIPKDVAYVHRNQSMIWRYFQPVYRPPALAVGLANPLRVGNDQRLGTDIASSAFGDLLAMHYRFAVIDDDHFEQIPRDIRAMILPCPLAMSDAAFSRLVAWVKGGGMLLVTGDFSRDEHRQRTRTERLRELTGVQFVEPKGTPNRRSENPEVPVDLSAMGLGAVSLRPAVRVQRAGCEVLGKTVAGEPALVRNRIGKGAVWYLTDPIEMAEDEATVRIRRQIYEAFIHAVDFNGESTIAPLSVVPNEPWLHALMQPTAKGNAYILYNTKAGAGAADVRVATAAGQVGVTARNGWPALAAVSDGGRVLAVSSDGDAAVDATRLFSGKGLKAILSLDGRDLRRSEAMLLAPFEPGVVELSRDLGLDCACIGEFRDGRWTTLEEIAIETAAPVVQINADRSTCLILLCKSKAKAEWIEHLTRSMLYPQQIKGY
ncbi:MAG TPA: beta-galactosidase trimerization domain-containing protein [Tepidisphaeraceae bacterium]|nr:beta-galactosidase trimerization domain-containing protein [Tepidisphaeraceae bacterium]